ncbi:hypothetical protein RQP53_03570 [Paucibacter sp. APW11]|uniref:Uncharacterized protein n=1 Tax=Roseateles aquae TaxID=3077235 RepID=A0ABU3P705_9BURK|nr:hypothetical protein [Paucibacter sp. APW11]MDT8998352.1 hypothetical protein [Paucibacter sp. APW11]
MNTETDPQSPAEPQNPAQGGSYMRDPVTGELTLVHATQPSTAAAQADGDAAQEA